MRRMKMGTYFFFFQAVLYLWWGLKKCAGAANNLRLSVYPYPSSVSSANTNSREFFELVLYARTAIIKLP